MEEIKFDLGKNIHEVAKESGAPSFARRNVAGLISYALVDIPEDIYVKFVRPGYEVRVPSVFSLRLYADNEHGPGLAVEMAGLMVSPKAISTHESAQQFVGNLVEQFQRGRWKRHLDELCPAVTGRSAYLNEQGQVDQLEACSLDPYYKISPEDWQVLMRNPQNYEWVGDGVLARLSIGYSEGSLGLRYSIDLDFDDFAVKKARDEKNLARELKEGDQAGWRSTETRNKDLDALRTRVKAWEESARKRGDSVIPR